MAIILASKSPRRQELMRLLGLEFTIHTADVDETMDKTLPPEREVARVGGLKAAKIAETCANRSSLWPRQRSAASCVRSRFRYSVSRAAQSTERAASVIFRIRSSSVFQPGRCSFFRGFFSRGGFGGLAFRAVSNRPLIRYPRASPVCPLRSAWWKS